MRSIHILLLFILGATAFGAEVRQLDKSGSLISLLFLNKNEWQINDHLCLQRGRITVACGQVIRARKQGVVVQLTIMLKKLKSKEQLQMVRINPTHKELASLLGIQESSLKSPWEQTQVSAGLNSILMLWPHVHFEQAISNQLAVGLMPNFISANLGNGSLQGFGFMATVSFYQRAPFSGLWVMLGGGMNVFSAAAGSTSENGLSAVGMGTVGWKIRWSSDVTLGLAGGATYFTNHSLTEFQHSGVIINGLAQFGFVL